jgi:hypothetical protein
MLKNGLDNCTCKKKDCERFGKCEECIAYHIAFKKYEPYCMRKRRLDKNRQNNAKQK